MELKEIKVGYVKDDVEIELLSDASFKILCNTKKMMLEMGYDVEDVKTDNCRVASNNFKALNDLYSICNKNQKIVSNGRKRN